jgi:rhamnulose-1-phosphate aldolase
MHGIYCAGHDLDETFGLVETVEKAAQIYMMTEAAGGAKNLISDDQLKQLAKRFSLTYRDGVI